MIYFIDKAALIAWVCGRFCSFFPIFAPGEKLSTHPAILSQPRKCYSSEGWRKRNEITTGRESFEAGQEGLPRVDVGEPETQDSKGLQEWLQHDAEIPELTLKDSVDT